MIAIQLGLDLGALGMSSVPIHKLAGSLIAIAIVYALTTSESAACPPTSCCCAA